MNISPRISTLAFFIIILFSAISAGTVSAADAKASYQVQSGDVLYVAVWKEEELQSDVIVRPDGGISFPLVGDLQAAGKSIPQINSEITKRMEKYIPAPVVSVSAKSLAGNKIYVIGQVKQPGEYPATSYLDVVQAISMAGGVTPFAAVNKIKILRRDASGKLKALSFKYAEVEKGDNLEQDIVLQARDVVVVP